MITEIAEDNSENNQFRKMVRNWLVNIVIKPPTNSVELQREITLTIWQEKLLYLQR